ncbi:unnamed protein product [Agarophyton chilense]|eukprot:gb/GEZJ01000954.1/.p1 GENE.gb/GEZJ01000954.1/~~gb/GEZJ01000954.1/.p1  ORF type:complete len:304 (-),score=20.25 gb/GEZJ01000954.1/:140-994(-)
MAHTSPVRVVLNGSASRRSDGGKPPPSKSSTPPSTTPSAPPSASPSSPSRTRREQPSPPRCEGCQSPHDASYGSGRFCSVHCARRVAASTKWQKQRMRARVKRLPSQKSSSRASSAQCSTHSTPFLLPANAAPMQFYRAPVARVDYDAAFVPQMVTLPYAGARPVAVRVAAAPYQQQQHGTLHQHVVPCTSCVTPYAAFSACSQPTYVPHSAPVARARSHGQSGTGAAAAITWPHQLFRYPSFKQNCANPVTNSTRRNESHAVAEALLRLKCSHGNSSKVNKKL